MISTTPFHVDMTPFYQVIFKGVIISIPLLFQMFLSTWYVWWILLFISAIKLGLEIYRLYKLSQAGMFEIDKMSGAEFEERIAIMFKNLGYTVQKTGKVGDYGVDLVIEKDGKRIAVQTKCYKSHVGEDAVREAYAGKNMYHCYESMVVTNSNFTKMAWRLAYRDNVKLWNRNYLAKVLLTEKSMKQV